jgi:hypothetical protein
MIDDPTNGDHFLSNRTYSQPDMALQWSCRRVADDFGYRPLQVSQCYLLVQPEKPCGLYQELARPIAYKIVAVLPCIESPLNSINSVNFVSATFTEHYGQR